MLKRRLDLRMSVFVLVLVAIAVAAFGSTISSASSTRARSTSPAVSGVAAATAAMNAAYKGTFGKVPTTPNPAPKHETVWVVSPGQASAPAAALSDGILQAAKSLGWKATLCDAKLNPSLEQSCFSNAIAAHPNAIFGVATDCPSIKSQLAAAKKAKITTIPVFSFDCNEVGAGPQLYTTQISFGKRYPNIVDYFKQSGVSGAAWVVAKTKGKANVLALNNTQYYDINYWDQGFASGMKKFCASCKVLNESYLITDLGPTLQQAINSNLIKDPSINAMQATFGNSILGAQQALKAAGKSSSIYSISGMGVPADVSAVRSGGITAMVGEPLTWWSYAAVDTYISLLNHKQPRDEGIGYQIFDKSRNLPGSGQSFEGTVPFKAAYEKSWGR